MRAALAWLARRGMVLRAVSRFFRTPAWPAGSGPDYVNAAARFSATLAAEEILALLHEAEHAFGRRRTVRFAPRTLDLDLLAVGAQVRPDPLRWRRWAESDPTAAPGELVLPHPRLHLRAFVLLPLAEVAPGWCHPVLGRTVADLAADLPEGERAGIRLVDPAG